MFVTKNGQEKMRGQRSQSMVEFALSLMALLILTSGLLDLGRAYFMYTAVADAAGEGALFLSTKPTCYKTGVGPGTTCSNPNNVQYRMQQAGGQLVDMSTATVTICYEVLASATSSLGSHCTTGTGALPDISPAYNYVASTDDTDVVVNVNYPFTLLTPVISSMVPNNQLPLNVTARMKIVSKES